ncbi:MAG TPA: kinase [Caulobacteraceae bacterium]|jgi:D-glycerate 3-kinase|nr:kinase [Caulobacteraceae bacterium]
MTVDLAAYLRQERLPESYAGFVDAALRPIAERVLTIDRRGTPLVVGVTGPQGSGKSAAAGALALLLQARGLRTAVLSIDDLYLTLAERRRLAGEVHPLLITRGVPGTHDVALGLAVIDSLGRATTTAVPRFDKATDDRRARAEWDVVEGPVDLILLEGWCVGARPQPDAALVQPVNDLERARDPDGVWRHYANAQLAGLYQTLFDKIGVQTLLRAPSFESVLGWRLEQEHKLRQREPGKGQTDAEIAFFVQHYERLTRWIDAEMPGRADAVVLLASDREVLKVTLAPPRSGERSAERHSRSDG